jgi:hypothetical protein
VVLVCVGENNMLLSWELYFLLSGCSVVVVPRSLVCIVSLMLVVLCAFSVVSEP